jgi:ribosomal protein L29
MRTDEHRAPKIRSKPDELLATQLAASRQLTASKRSLAQARKLGNTSEVAAARRRRDQAYAEFVRVTNDVLRELQHISLARSGHRE